MQILKAEALIEVPWKNAGGITRNIAKGIVLDHSAWTLSRADVAKAGPFSDFSGMMRVLTVVSGGTLILDTPESSITTKLWSPVRFDGGISVRSRLTDGPITDFNLMFDPKHCEGTVVTRTGPLTAHSECPAQGLLAFHGLAGTPKVAGVHIHPADTAFETQTSVGLELVAGDALLEVNLSYLDQSSAIRLCIADR
jgi:environmental stress-induced protein Ves